MALNGYITTGEERYLRSERRELRAYPEQMGRLDALVSDEPDQQRHMTTADLVNAKRRLIVAASGRVGRSAADERA
jgi:CHASE3 domain sensor protein